MAGKSHRVGKSLIDVQKEFGTDEQCHAYLEQARWPDGVRCLQCDCDKVSKFVTNETKRERVNRKGETVEVRVPARRLYQCLNPACNYQFSVTTGTLFNDSHLPLQKWFLAVGIMCNAKKGVSAKQLERDLGVNYRTAWYLAHRIRKAMADGAIGEQFSGVVEMDETYVGGKFDPRRHDRWHENKETVFGMVERGGNVKAWHIQKQGKFASITGKIKQNVAVDAALVLTDESRLYAKLNEQGYRHAAIEHSIGQYVQGIVHTNSIENFWSLFKRGVIGSFHKVSIKHLDRYLAEFCFRFNGRRNQELFAMTILYLVIASALPYQKLIGREHANEEPF